MTALVLVGPHGVGKSTVGAAVAERLGLPFHDEIGRRLAASKAHRPDGADAEAPQDAFDRAVFAEELARDVCRGHRVVETWHPGNLAYAAARSPRVVPEVLPRVRAACADHVVAAVIVLRASTEVLARRQSEPGDLAFFERVGRDAVMWAERLGLPILGVVDTDIPLWATTARVLNLYMRWQPHLFPQHHLGGVL